jgi:hypothetical protein
MLSRNFLLSKKVSNFLPPEDTKIFDDANNFRIEFVLKMQHLSTGNFNEMCCFSSEHMISTKKNLDAPRVFLSMADKYFSCRGPDNKLKVYTYFELYHNVMCNAEHKNFIELAYYDHKRAFEYYKNYYCQNTAKYKFDRVHLQKPTQIQYYTSAQLLS